METTVKFRPTTRRGYHGVLERHVRPYCTGRRMVDIDSTDVDEFIADQLSPGRSPKYVRECGSVLSLIIQAAMHSKVRRDNPAKGHKFPTRQRRIREGDILDMAQVLKLVAEVRDPYKPAVWLMVYAGLRPAELCGLRASSVDMARHIEDRSQRRGAPIVRGRVPIPDALRESRQSRQASRERHSPGALQGRTGRQDPDL